MVSNIPITTQQSFSRVHGRASRLATVIFGVQRTRRRKKRLRQRNANLFSRAWRQVQLAWNHLELARWRITGWGEQHRSGGRWYGRRNVQQMHFDVHLSEPADGGVEEHTCASQKSHLSWEQIEKCEQGLECISNVKFTPDSKHVLYLKSGKKAIYATEVTSGRTRPVVLMKSAVKSFQTAGAKNSPVQILIPMGSASRLYLQHGIAEGSACSCLFNPASTPLAAPLGPSGPVSDPQISKDGSLVCFVWSSNLYCIPSDGSVLPRALTAGARCTRVTRGLANKCGSYFSEEKGFWISPDATRVAYEEVDATLVCRNRYSFPGEPIPKVNLYVVSTTVTGSSEGVPVPVELDLTTPYGEEFYLGSVVWLSDGALAVQVLSRNQQNNVLLRCEPAKGDVQQIVTEHSNAWVNVHHMLKPLEMSGKFLWASECTGFCHLYMYDPACPSALQPLTGGNWIVEEVVAVDEEAGMVFFMGTSEGQWLERHLFKVQIDVVTSHAQQITRFPGRHSVFVDSNNTCFVDIVDSAEQPSIVTLRSLSDNRELLVVQSCDDQLIKALAFQPPRFASFPSTDGKVMLQAAVYRPDPKVHGPGPYPTIVACYGGPNRQRVSNSWSMTVDLQVQSLRSRGFLVLKLDNRGTTRRGLDFQAPIKHQLGFIEVDDQIAGVRYCIDKCLCDASKVGIYGGSYGGYLSIMGLLRAPGIFKCAAAVAPVTSWDRYEACFTERYMGTPEENPDGYTKSSAVEHVKHISGDLLLVHGRLDENVYFQHTTRLINALNAAQKPYHLLRFPNGGHYMVQKDRAYMEEQIATFFQTCLRGSQSPRALFGV